MTATTEVTWSRRTVAVALVAGAAAVVPIVVALVRAVADGWYPVGDNGFLALRSRDVLTEHNPLFGTWTSASISVGDDIHNPGPLMFDLFAPFVRVAPAAGLAVASALLNVASIVAMGLVARRRGGPLRTTAVLVGAAVLVWTMGSELVIDPWQPHVLLLPYLLFLTVAWSMAEGDLGVLPLAVVTASLLVETHLSYALLVPVIGLVGVAASGWALQREHVTWAARWVAVRRPLLGGLAAAAVCWALPVYEQLTATRGNLGRVLGSAGAGDDPALGLGLAGRVVTSVVAVPPAWWRPSFDEAFARDLRLAADDPHSILGLPSTAVAAAALVGLGLLLAAGGLVSVRRRDRGGLAGTGIALLALGLALVTTSILPLGALGLGPHRLRFLWPTAVFILVVLVVTLLGRVRATAPVLTGVGVVLAVWALPTYAVASGPAADAEARPVMREVSAQLAGLRVDGPVLIASEEIDKLAAQRLFEPYSPALMYELDRRGVELVGSDAEMARQLGDSRLHPEEATSRLVIELGLDAEAPPGGERIALVEGLDDRERAETERLHAELRARDDLRLDLTGEGRRLARAGTFPGVTADGAVDAVAALDAGSVARIVASGYGRPASGSEALARYTELRHRAAARSVSVYLVPIDRPEGGT